MQVDYEYLKSLDDLSEMINEQNAEHIDATLDEIYQIKPVRLKWFLLKAQTTKLLKKDTTQIYETLFKKYNLLYNDEKLKSIANCLISLNDKECSESKRLAYHIAKKENKSDEVISRYKEYELLTDKYMDDSLSQNEFIQLIENCYIRNDFIQYVLFSIVYEKKFNTSITINDWVFHMPNVEFLVKRLKNKERKNYIVAYSDEDSFNCNAIIKALSELDNNVFFIDNLLDIEVEQNVNIADTLAISVENSESNSYCKILHPVRLYCNGEVSGDNIDYIINFINQYVADDNLTMILSSGSLANKLCRSALLQKNTERLSLYKADYFEDNLNFCWSGDYTSYMSEFYGMDVKKLLNQEVEYDYSIVIPVRNSIDTFKYTLKSCLELKYDGKYEIVISDNSTDGNSNVYDYIKSLNDSRINYYKTPFSLPLTKSFEYAFLKAKGSFIFSIGADDAVLPWALAVLDTTIKQMPDVELIRWDRVLYCWPGFNYGQQNEFIIPKAYSRKSINVEHDDSIECLKNVIANPNNYMYAMPLLYINSGFRRSYLNKLLKETGRLWDGPAQDLCMGILNLSINYCITHIQFPLTIAGMSGHSSGMMSTHQPGIITDPCPPYPNVITVSYYEHLIPPIGIDVQNLYSAILRAASRGLVPEEIIRVMLNNINIFERQIGILEKDFDMYDEYINMYQHCIGNISESLLSEFNDKLYDILYLPKAIPKPTDNQHFTRSYEVGFSQYGVLTLDASEFDVKNVYDAVKLLEKIIGSVV